MGLCDSPIECSNKDITPEDALKKLIQVDANGCPALNTVLAPSGGGSPSGCVPYFDCSNKEEDWKTIFFKMITADANGCWALRIIESNPA